MDMLKRITESIGYKNMILALDDVFKENYQILKVIPDDDETSYDFSTIMNIGKCQGLDIGVSVSGNSHQFQVGAGVMGVAVPKKNAFFILPSGKNGTDLSELVSDKSLRVSASADNLNDVHDLFLSLKKYLKETNQY